MVLYEAAPIQKEINNPNFPLDPSRTSTPVPLPSSTYFAIRITPKQCGQASLMGLPPLLDLFLTNLAQLVHGRRFSGNHPLCNLGHLSEDGLVGNSVMGR